MVKVREILDLTIVPHFTLHQKFPLPNKISQSPAYSVKLFYSPDECILISIHQPSPAVTAATSFFKTNLDDSKTFHQTSISVDPK
jgi:hypothetical protein